MEIEGNELADVAAKEATRWRKVKKRNGKLHEIDTKHTALLIPLLFLKSVGKAHLSKLLFEKWEEEWQNETKGCALFKIATSPIRKELNIHGKLPKWVSSLIVQIRTGKIGLQKFLHKRNLPEVKDARCGCSKGGRNCETCAYGMPTF